MSTDDSEKPGTYGVDFTKAGAWRDGVPDPNGMNYNTVTFEGGSVQYNSQEAEPLRGRSGSWWSTIMGWFKQK